MTRDPIEQERRLGTQITMELIRTTVAPFAIGIALGMVIGVVMAWMVL
jgi:hypothetical protein